MRKTMVALTTIDNPFDPFDQEEEWGREDRALARKRGTIDSQSLLGYYALTSDELSEEENHRAIEEAINQIIRDDMLRIYKKVTKEVEVKS